MLLWCSEKRYVQSSSKEKQTFGFQIVDYKIIGLIYNFRSFRDTPEITASGFSKPRKIVKFQENAEAVTSCCNVIRKRPCNTSVL